MDLRIVEVGVAVDHAVSSGSVGPHRVPRRHALVRTHRTNAIAAAYFGATGVFVVAGFVSVAGLVAGAVVAEAFSAGAVVAGFVAAFSAGTVVAGFVAALSAGAAAFSAGFVVALSAGGVASAAAFSAFVGVAYPVAADPVAADPVAAEPVASEPEPTSGAGVGAGAGAGAASFDPGTIGSGGATFSSGFWPEHAAANTTARKTAFDMRGP